MMRWIPQNIYCLSIHYVPILYQFWKFLISCHIASLSWQEPEEELNKLLLRKVSDKDRNVKVKMFGSVESIVSFCTSSEIIKLVYELRAYATMNYFDQSFQSHESSHDFQLL